MRRLAAAAAVVAATGVAVAVPVSAGAQLPASPVVEQGMKILIDQGNGLDNVCTVGHNDPAQRSSFTAAHCGTPGQLVYLEDEDGQRIDTPVGHFTPSPVYRHPATYTGSPSANDWGQIRWFSTVEIAENAYGPYLGPDAVNRGDTLCYRGATTGAPVCGNLVGTIGESMFFDVDVNSQAGDSGGPVFVPGKGTVGVLSGMSMYDDKLGRAKTLERASRLQNGYAFSAYDVDRLFESYFPVMHARPEIHTPIEIQPHPAPRVQETHEDQAVSEPIAEPEVQPNDQSSKRDEAIGIAVGLILGLLALVPLIGGVLGWAG